MPMMMTGRRRILIVDDEAAVADSLRLIFSSQGYDVRTAYSAEEAIDVISKWEPDLAVIDVMLPRMNGIDLAIIVKDNYPDSQLLLVSGHPGTGELLLKAKDLGHCFEILAKPLHPTLILDTVASLLPRMKREADA